MIAAVASSRGHTGPPGVCYVSGVPRATCPPVRSTVTSMWQRRLVRPCVALGTSGQCVGSTPRDALADKLPVPPVRSTRDADTTAGDLCVYSVRIPGHPQISRKHLRGHGLRDICAASVAVANRCRESLSLSSSSSSQSWSSSAVVFPSGSRQPNRVNACQARAKYRRPRRQGRWTTGQDGRRRQRLRG